MNEEFDDNLDNLVHKDLENIVTGLGSAYLKKHYYKFMAKYPVRSKSRNEKFIKMIGDQKFIDVLINKIKLKILSKYSKQFTEAEIDLHFETILKDHKDVFLERVRIELNRQSDKQSTDEVNN